MKKKFLLTIVLFFSAATLFGQLQISDAAKKNLASSNGDGASFPDISFQTTDGNPFLKSNLASNQSVIVFYFDPDCDHCQTQAGWMNKARAKFKNISLLWVSWGEMQDIAKFRQRYMPDIVSPCHMTKDVNFAFDDYFGYSEIPSIYVYKWDVKGWTRTASFKKETEPDILLKFAQ